MRFEIDPNKPAAPGQCNGLIDGGYWRSAEIEEPMRCAWPATKDGMCPADNHLQFDGGTR